MKSFLTVRILTVQLKNKDVVLNKKSPITIQFIRTDGNYQSTVHRLVLSHVEDKIFFWLK